MRERERERESFHKDLKLFQKKSKIYSSISSATRYVKNGSIFPKGKEHVSSMIVKTMARAGKKVVESAIGSIKKHNEKGKIRGY